MRGKSLNDDHIFAGEFDLEITHGKFNDTCPYGVSDLGPPDPSLGNKSLPTLAGRSLQDWGRENQPGLRGPGGSDSGESALAFRRPASADVGARIAQAGHHHHDQRFGAREKLPYFARQKFPITTAKGCRFCRLRVPILASGQMAGGTARRPIS